MARGVDFPDVDWVVQFEIPQNAENFVHRCGRTARAGKGGSSVIFLQPNEQSYVKFLKINQKIKTLEKMKLSDISSTGTDTLLKLCKADRRVCELATKAYVSFVQAYSKHEQSVLIRAKDLEYGKLGTGYVLFQLPSMPELRLRKHNTKDFTCFFEDMFMEDIPYKDKSLEKHREKSRLERIAKRKADKEAGVTSNRKKWSKSKAAKEKTKKRRLERREKKEFHAKKAKVA